jgi:hypothetical protein
MTRPLFDHIRKALVSAAAAGLAVGALASTATALETLSPAEVKAPVGDACPELTAVKYPWVTCRANEHGGVTLLLPSQPAPRECNWRMPDGSCAASEREWGIVRRARLSDE